MSRTDGQLERLATLSPAELREEWNNWFDSAVPRLPPDLMRHAIAHAMQEKAFGKLSRRIEKQISDPHLTPPRSRMVIGPGTQLVRSWNNRTISVDVTESGFLFEGRAYRSLSSIAREVTGVQWSGPRFFGLNANGR